MIKRTSFAATAVLVAAFAFTLLIGNSEAIALEDVVEKVKNAQTLSFRVELSRPNPNEKGKPLVKVVERSIRGSHMRTKDSTGDIRINHMNKGTILSLRPAIKVATIIQGNPEKKKQPIDEVVELLRELRRDEFKNLGIKDVDKKKAEGFLAHQKGPSGKQWEIEVWVDVKTGLPIKMEQRMGKRRAVFDRFVWNEKMEDSLFSLSPPPGYEVRTRTQDAPTRDK